MRQVDSSIVEKAIAQYCASAGITFSSGSGEDGHARWRVFSPEADQTQGVIVRLVEGKLACEDASIKTALAEIVIDMMENEPAPARAPAPVVRTNGRAATPERCRTAPNGQMVRSLNELTIDDIKKHFCPLASDQEAFFFLQTCLRTGADPWQNHAYLVKYDEKSPAKTIMGKYFFLKKAEAHPQYGGMSSGIIVKNSDGQTEDRIGIFKLSDETLLGAWCEVTRLDRNVPIRKRVPLAEYDRGNSQWRKMPATMIEKVAIVQAHRDAFPSDLGGLYDAAEVIEAEFKVEAEP